MFKLTPTAPMIPHSVLDLIVGFVLEHFDWWQDEKQRNGKAMSMCLSMWLSDAAAAVSKRESEAVHASLKTFIALVTQGYIHWENTEGAHDFESLVFRSAKTAVKYSNPGTFRTQQATRTTQATQASA
jgi:hypothetical protein